MLHRCRNRTFVPLSSLDNSDLVFLPEMHPVRATAIAHSYSHTALRKSLLTSR